MSSVELTANGTKQKFTEEKNYCENCWTCIFIDCIWCWTTTIEGCLLQYSLRQRTPCSSDSLLSNTPLLSL